MEIIIGGQWPNEDIQTVRALLYFTSGSFLSMVNRNFNKPVLVVNEPTRTNPMINFEKINGAYLVFLSSPRGSLWSKIIYQYSHELCHIHCNFDLQRQHKHKWFEETICELASVHNLLNICTLWEISPPIEGAQTYSAAIREYALDLKQRSERISPLEEDFQDWFIDKLPKLEEDSGKREENSVVANRLLPIFFSDRKYWEAVAFLNTWPCSNDQTFCDFLISWEEQAPENLKSCIREISGAFGYELEPNKRVNRSEEACAASQ